MPCAHPLPAYRRPNGVVSLREPLLFQEGQELLRLPCGSCLGCRMSRAREWSLRCGLELQSHETACWATLTYDDKHLPPTLSKRHLSGWLKRLRARVKPKIRFFASGEYGERNGRPHYHAILFGLPRDNSHIASAWPHGFVRVDPLTPAAIAYVAGYSAKKIGARDLGDEKLDLSTGELYIEQNAFILMSRNPGLGGAQRSHWQSWRDSAIYGGNKIPVPRFLHASWLKNSSLTQQLQLSQEKQTQNLLNSQDLNINRTFKDRLAASAAITAHKHNSQSAKREL